MTLGTLGTPEGRLLSPAAAARWLGVSPVTVRRWLAAGRLPGRRIGARWYTTRAELARALETRTAATPEGAAAAAALAR